jgi:hypothetical protein
MHSHWMQWTVGRFKALEDDFDLVGSLLSPGNNVECGDHAEDTKQNRIQHGVEVTKNSERS